MVGAIIFVFEIFRIDLKNVRNRAEMFLKVDFHLFLSIYKFILSESKAQIHVYHTRMLLGEVLRP